MSARVPLDVTVRSHDVDVDDLRDEPVLVGRDGDRVVLLVHRHYAWLLSRLICAGVAELSRDPNIDRQAWEHIAIDLICEHHHAGDRVAPTSDVALFVPQQWDGK